MKCKRCKQHGGAHLRTCPEWVPPRSRRASEVIAEMAAKHGLPIGQPNPSAGHWQVIAHHGASRPHFASGGYIGPRIDQSQESTAPEPAEPPPVIEGELVGFRQWTIDADWKLAGCGHGHQSPWTPGTNEATCGQDDPTTIFLRDRHNAPGPNCHCGFNCYAKPREAWRSGRLENLGWQGGHLPAVPGAVLAWGDEFYMHPGGFRAQYAKPVLLAICDEWPRAMRLAVEAIAEEYGCDTCDFAILEGAAREHGQLVTEDMMPEAASVASDFVVNKAFTRAAAAWARAGRSP